LFLGFFSHKSKKFGQFLCIVNTWTNKLFVQPIKNTKQEELIKAIGSMTKVKKFNKYFIL